MKPLVVGDLKKVDASYRSGYGMIRSNWEKTDKNFKWRISVPVNTHATVYVPAKDANGIKEGGKPIADNKEVKFLRMEEGYAVYEIPSGDYEIVNGN